MHSNFIDFIFENKIFFFENLKKFLDDYKKHFWVN